MNHIILLVRGERVVLDTDLARLYGVPTKVLNQAVKRNRGRFPTEFAFRLTKTEKTEVVTNCDHLAHLKFSPAFPIAFTEHGVLMAASLLNSRTAIRVSIAVVQGFVRLRRAALEHAALTRRLNELENKYDGQFKVVFDALRALLEPPDPPRKPIGYHTELQDA